MFGNTVSAVFFSQALEATGGAEEEAPVGLQTLWATLLHCQKKGILGKALGISFVVISFLLKHFGNSPQGESPN